jgi:hypothetical protein
MSRTKFVIRTPEGYSISKTLAESTKITVATLLNWCDFPDI